MPASMRCVSPGLSAPCVYQLALGGAREPGPASSRPIAPGEGAAAASLKHLRCSQQTGTALTKLRLVNALTQSGTHASSTKKLAYTPKSNARTRNFRTMCTRNAVSFV
eukprot:3611365-Rhodomonas_salina.1